MPWWGYEKESVSKDRISQSLTQTINNQGSVGKKEVMHIDLYHKNLKNGNKSYLPSLSGLTKVKQGEKRLLSLTCRWDPGSPDREVSYFGVLCPSQAWHSAELQIPEACASR